MLPGRSVCGDVDEQRSYPHPITRRSRSDSAIWCSVSARKRTEEFANVSGLIGDHGLEEQQISDRRTRLREVDVLQNRILLTYHILQ